MDSLRPGINHQAEVESVSVSVELADIQSGKYSTIKSSPFLNGISPTL